jgi:pyruvate/2-oxoglutarate dehydrogenase complex dihydrolipoamide acyltransferase (E2) component
MKRTTFDIMIPRLSDEIIDCQITRWHKDVGEFVREGDVLVELETEKTTIEIESPASGILEGIYVFEGEEVIENERIGVINTIDDIEDEDSNDSLDDDEVEIFDEDDDEVFDEDEEEDQTYDDDSEDSDDYDEANIGEPEYIAKPDREKFKME